MDIYFTWYRDSSKTNVGPVTPMKTRGWPERNANIKPPIDVIMSVSLTPIHFSVFSPKNTRNTRTIQEVLNVCTISNWSMWLLKCFEVYEEPLQGKEIYSELQYDNIFAMAHCRYLDASACIKTFSPWNTHFWSYDYWLWWKVLSKKMKVTFYASTILITPSHYEAPVWSLRSQTRIL